MRSYQRTWHVLFVSERNSTKKISRSAMFSILRRKEISFHSTDCLFALMLEKQICQEEFHKKTQSSHTFTCKFFCFVSDITNGGFQSSVNNNSTSNLTTAASPIMITPVTSRTTNYEILADEMSDHGLTQATIISEPYFDAQTPRNVTGLVGKLEIDMRDNFSIFAKTSGEQFDDNRKFVLSPFRSGKSAYLSCRVRNLANKTVSWIRHRDIHILTVGSYTYTSDQRFQATHHKENDEWTLQIKWAQKRDGGGNSIVSTQRLIETDWIFFSSFSSFFILDSL